MSPIADLQRLIFQSSRWKLLVFLLGAALLKTGIWYIPNLEASRRLALDPFVNPFPRPESHYLLWNWLGPFLAWLIGATGDWSFFLFHLVFSFAFTGLFCWVSFARLPDRNARVAIVLFALLPVSETTFYWVGMDSLTLFLMLGAFLLPERRFWALGIGVLLGMQHFEQALVATTALLVAILLQNRLQAYTHVSLLWCGLLVVGVLAGKVLLTSLFHYHGVVVAIERGYWASRLLPMLTKQFISTFHFQIWSVLGLGWLVVIGHPERGWRSFPFLVPLCGLLGLLILAYDQTRVLAIVTFPLIFVFWLRNQDLLNSLDERFVSWAVLTWLLTPWVWVFGGKPQSSVLPYNLAVVVSRVTGLLELPTDLAFWPFWYVPPQES